MLAEHEVSITIKVATIRDGAPGITITTPDRLLGEWPDSRAASLSITDNLAISVQGENGDEHYLITMPGTPVRGEQISDTEALIVVRF